MICRLLLGLAAVALMVNVVVFTLQESSSRSFASRWAPVLLMPRSMELLPSTNTESEQPTASAFEREI